MQKAHEIKEILRIRVDAEVSSTGVIRTVRGSLGTFPPETSILHPEGCLGISEFLEGQTVRWNYFHAEFHYVLKGKAKMTYSLAPWHDAQGTLTLETGDAYLIPRGAEVTWTVAPGAPFRHLCVHMPAESMYEAVEPLNSEPACKRGITEG